MKNPFQPDTPEWQLCENMKGAVLRAVAADADAQRYLSQAAAAREKADVFRAALQKLAPDYNPEV